ncbi:MAG TPA: hypothetical protein VEI29_05690 [Burkholderiaceae bacterium]|nr:hypothetical protein [Burkholderiaceae bacterium]
MALVKKIIDEHDGKIEIINREGASGATVTIVLHRLARALAPVAEAL